MDKKSTRSQSRGLYERLKKLKISNPILGKLYTRLNKLKKENNKPPT